VFVTELDGVSTVNLTMGVVFTAAHITPEPPGLGGPGG
jgi:hypothetical protein